ncbi:MAG: hypothetical protein ABIK28_17920 [Planctomycetota bacterium]
MKNNLDIFNFAVTLIIKAALLAARFSGRIRKRSLKRLAAMSIDAKDKEVLFLQDKIHELRTLVSIFQKRIRKNEKNTRYTLQEKLLILFHMETFQIPRRRVYKYFGIARSTLYRWLHKIEEQRESLCSADKTPNEIAAFIWEITKANVHWGRFRIANQLALLNIFISASTVRNILNRPKPRKETTKAFTVEQTKEQKEPRSIPAWYPNHVWSIDTTTILSWGLWPIHIFVAIDHYSRKVVSVTPLEGPNSGWILDALEKAFEKCTSVHKELERPKNKTSHRYSTDGSLFNMLAPRVRR